MLGTRASLGGYRAYRVPWLSPQVSVEEPPKRKAGIMVSSVEELVDKLKNEAKCI